jgi:hypothetical protein
MKSIFFTVSLGSMLLANAAYAQNHTRISGTYSLAAVYDQTEDGQKHNPWGDGATGSLILTRNGRFSGMIVSANRDKGASKSPRTPVGPVIAYYGTYTVSADGKSLVYHVERSTFPGWDNVERTVNIDSVSANRLELVTTVTGDAALGNFKSHQSWVRTK